MKNPVKEVYNAVVPDYRDLWNRGGADVRNVEIEPGRHVDVPFFDLEIAGMKDDESGTVFNRSGKEIGDYQTFVTETSDGLFKTSRLYTPTDSHGASHDAILHADTAWTTTVKGHNHDMASQFMDKTGLPMLVVGAEDGTNNELGLFEFLKMPDSFELSKTISLSKSAQTSQLITAAIRDRYGLSDRIVKTGESRGAMLTPGHFPYAELYGNEIVYSDITAPCVPKKLFSESGDWLRLAKWPTSEILGTLAVGASIIKQRGLKRQLGTVSFNPNSIISNVAGVGPALFSGEAGEFASWVPRSAPIYLSTFKNDTVSRPDVWQELFEEHENVYIRVHKSGTHMTLVKDGIVDSKANRMNAVLDVMSRQGGNISKEQLHSIYQMGRRSVDLSLAA